MAVASRVPIGLELVRRGIVSEEDIEEAINYQKRNPHKKLGDILNILNLCPERELIKAMGEILGEKVIILQKESVIINVTDYISLDICKQCKAVVFDVIGDKAKVCFADTANKKFVEQMRLILLNKGLVMEKYLTFETNIENVLDALEGKYEENISSTVTGKDITTLIDTIIKSAIKKRASDIHFEPFEGSVRIRYRIDGELITVANIDKNKQSQIIGRLKAISNMHQEKQQSQDGRILMYSNYNIRVSSQQTIYGEKFCLRLLKKDDGIRNIYELGFPKDEKLLKNCFNKRNSITVIAAPTGAGKTTTLYSILDYLNRPEINITTVEEPVEIRMAGINQIEKEERESFADILKTILRQDPDIILLGEIRDIETAEMAFQAGQTGHYVLTTIHTVDSIEVITRLRKLGISNYDISSTLATSVSQRLLRRICPHCAVKRKYTEEEKEKIEKVLGKYGEKIDFNGKTTYDIKGCKECNHTGYYGRVACYEILNITDEIKELISDNASSLKIKEIAIEQGYRPLVVDAIQKVLDGISTLDEVNNQLAIF